MIFTQLSASAERSVGFMTVHSHSNCDGSLKGHCYMATNLWRESEKTDILRLHSVS